MFDFGCGSVKHYYTGQVKGMGKFLERQGKMEKE